MRLNRWHQQDLFEMPDPTIAPNSRPGSATSLNKDSSPTADIIITEDMRQIIDGWVTVRDSKGTSFIYGTAGVSILMHISYVSFDLMIKPSYHRCGDDGPSNLGE